MTTELTLCFKLRFVAAAAVAAADDAAADDDDVEVVPFSLFGLKAGSWTVLLDGGLTWGGGTVVDEVLKR
jgi:hypothetical protein